MSEVFIGVGFCEDLFRSLGTDKRTLSIFPRRDGLTDLRVHVLHTREDPSTDDVLVDNPEPDLDKLQLSVPISARTRCICLYPRNAPRTPLIVRRADDPRPPRAAKGTDRSHAREGPSADAACLMRAFDSAPELDGPSARYILVRRGELIVSAALAGRRIRGEIARSARAALPPHAFVRTPAERSNPVLAVAA